MPNYGGTVFGLYPGVSVKLFNAEAPTAPQASVAISCARPASLGYKPVVFDIEFSAAPTDSLVIQGAMTDSDALYQNLFTSANKQQDSYADVGGFNFYRAKLVSWTVSGTLTVTVRG